MKIAFFLANLGSGGAERVTCTLANYLSDSGHEVIIITLLKCQSVYKLNDNIRIIPLSNHTTRDQSGIRGMVHHIQRFRAYGRCIKAEAPAIIVAMLNIPIYISLLSKNKHKIPVVVSERGDPYTLYSRGGIHSILVKKLYPMADKLIFQTQMASKFFSEIPAAKKTVIPNPLNEKYTCATPFTGPRNHEIVAVGRLNSAKNYPLLLRAFAKLDIIPKPELKIYGEGELEDTLKALASSLGIADKVHFMGYRKDIDQEIVAAGCYVLSSDHEGMPNALMEALALGLPCISTDCPCGAPKMLIEDGVNGLLVPVGDEKALVNAIKKIFTDRDAAEKYGQRAQLKMRAYLPDIICARWMDLLLAEAKSNHTSESAGLSD